MKQIGEKIGGAMSGCWMILFILSVVFGLLGLLYEFLDSIHNILRKFLG